MQAVLVLLFVALTLVALVIVFKIGKGRSDGADISQVLFGPPDKIALFLEKYRLFY